MHASRSDIVALDKRRVWHPYTEMGSYIAETDPLVIARAEGARLFDVDGRSFLDANSSWWCARSGMGIRASWKPSPQRKSSAIVRSPASRIPRRRTWPMSSAPWRLRARARLLQ